ncbi:uncharacterized protein H6S33_012116 [Morchella sextelata]|uniref:uncharacterized protein n=1 Tax=Morchella sextelata TaxID=1174677 RepID=UPI001D045049|nr:uncharacterized protein H6S33_012116 [Morchella sextelata]KAH0610589.1 hypothetical protein H6S33_012116 [Morchella sextelata]
MNGDTKILSALTEAEITAKYRPFLLSEEAAAAGDWVSELELDAVTAFVEEHRRKEDYKPLKFLVLYGSLRECSYSRKMAYEASRILHRLGADVRVFDPRGLPVKDDVQHDHPKVQELRTLSHWSDGHLWCSPEQHGNLTAVFKNQIDWIPLATGSVRPTQGRTLAVVQVNGGSQSFNTVNALRVLGRWMRMFTIPNQSSLPMAWTQFTDEGRLMKSGNRDRLVDVCEELVRVSFVLRPSFDMFADRYSERMEKRAKEEKERAERERKEKEAAEVESAQELKDVKA